MAASSGNVRIIQLGCHAGEFCRRDRAMLFGDPDGTRILYDASLTIASPDDPRLDKIDVVLPSSVHGNNLGNNLIAAVNADICAKSKADVQMPPNSNTAAIIASKKAKSYAGSKMLNFLRAKVKAADGSPDQIDVLRFSG